MNKRLAIILSGLLAAALAVWLLVPKDQNQITAAPRVWDAQEEGASATPEIEQFPVQLRTTVTRFAEAYYSSSYDDDHPSAWLDRTLPWCTDAYGKELRSLYGSGSGGNTWAEIESMHLVSSAQGLEVSEVYRSSEEATYLLTFEHVTESDDGDGYRPIQKIVELENTRKGWLVKGWTDLSDGPTFTDQIAPTDSPDQEYFVD
ncbi:hypothetical protein FQ154_19870 [Paeniglutamicibacter gangotriensis]|uniref:Uncharacterized protein n=1 Tax=Paeniglutamicibacter gangotriensis TaxID=254787 RepID=A0A5B0E447_9MICC|nr:hypothetical protein [Paeniglutamicibacter gangotriensis]KAA0973112.1 hypothetical protein FQ154_19870 [Paeniglutamicibacter gangotriensis]